MPIRRIVLACGALIVLGAGSAAAQSSGTVVRAGADTSARSPLAGVYTLVAIDDHALPFTPPHEGVPPGTPRPEVVASTLVVRADGSFIHAMGYRMTIRGEARITVQPFSGRCLPDGSAFVAQWDGAGRTPVTFARDTLVIDNEGVRFQFRKNR